MICMLILFTVFDAILTWYLLVGLDQDTESLEVNCRLINFLQKLTKSSLIKT